MLLLLWRSSTDGERLLRPALGWWWLLLVGRRLLLLLRDQVRGRRRYHAGGGLGRLVLLVLVRGHLLLLLLLLRVLIRGLRWWLVVLAHHLGLRLIDERWRTVIEEWWRRVIRWLLLALELLLLWRWRLLVHDHAAVLRLRTRLVLGSGRRLLMHIRHGRLLRGSEFEVLAELAQVVDLHVSVAWDDRALRLRRWTLNLLLL